MFGLMPPPSNCASSCDNLYNSHRKHYCGTCKTIGQHYGQSARWMLNFDAVFLAELLSLLSNDDTISWQPALQKVNICWQMPEKNSQDSLALQYAATTNVLLGELKIKDNIGDTNKKRWKILHRFFSSSFLKAKKRLEDWAVDTNEILDLAQEQEKLEKQAFISNNSIAELLHYYATPTAKITAKIFEKGATVIQQESAASKMYELGYAYGLLAYMLDAFSDLGLDVYKKEFNPIASFYNGAGILSEEQIEGLRILILNQQNTVIQLVNELNIAENHQLSFAARLESSIVLELYKERVVPTSMADSLKHRWNSAKEKANHLFCQQSKGLLQLKYYLVVFAVFFSPHATEEILPADSKSMVFSWIGLITALMGSVAYGMFYNTPREKSKRLLRQEERRKKRAEKKQEKKQENFIKRLFDAIKKQRSNCIGDACQTCGELIAVVIYFLVAGFAVVGAIVGLIGFILLQPWGAILLIIALLSALLVAGFGFFADSFQKLMDSVMTIALVFSIIIAIICIVAIIVAIVALLALFNPFVLATLIVAAVVLLALILMTIFSEVFDYI